MSEIRSLLSATTSGSLVLIDEICRGTETAKGTCIAGSIVQTLDACGCLAIVSTHTHLHGIFDLPLRTRNTVYKSMSADAEYIDGQTMPTWKLVDGICKENLAFETAKREGVPDTVVKRAEELYQSVYVNDTPLKVTAPQDLKDDPNVNGGNEVASTIAMASQKDILKGEVQRVVSAICKKKLMMQTDDLQGRIQAHRAKDGMQSAIFISFLAQVGKSIACQLETLLINQLPKQGFHLANIADGKHRNFGTNDTILKAATVVESSAEATLF